MSPASNGASANLSSATATVGDDGTAEVNATANSTVGDYTVTASIAVGVTVSFSLDNLPQPVFTGLTNPSITYGTSSVTIGGTLAGGPPATSDESVAITLGSTTQDATIGSEGVFSSSFNTADFGVVGSPYPITYTYSGDADFGFASATGSLTVTKATPTISWADPADVAYGTPLTETQLDASPSVPGIPTYTPAAGTVLPVGDDQTLSVSFTPSDTADYNDAVGSAMINVDKATPEITWPNPADIVYGTPLSGTQLDATALVPGSFSYAPGPGTVLNAGEDQTLSVLFTPSDSIDYDDTVATAVINVDQVTPTLTWATPAPITYGTALSVEQLNATASVPGKFIYTPAGRHGIGLRHGAGAVGQLHADGLGRFCRRDRLGHDHGHQGQADDHLGESRVHHLWHAAFRDAARRDRLGARHVHLHAGRGDGLGRRHAPGAFGELHADRFDRLHDRCRQCEHQRQQGQAGDHLGRPGRYHLRDRPVADAARRDRVGAGHAHLHAGGRCRARRGADQTLSVSFAPTDSSDFTTATGTVAIDVDKAVPAITWASPTDIPYGTPLLATQLDATSPVAGSLTFTPGAGTVLTPGADQTLSALFTPDRHGRFYHGHGNDDDQRYQDRADDHLVRTGRNHLWNAAVGDAARRHRQHPRDVQLSAGRGDVADGRQWANAGGDLHAGGSHRLCSDTGEHDDRRGEGNAGAQAQRSRRRVRRRTVRCLGDGRGRRE